MAAGDVPHASRSRRRMALAARAFLGALDADQPYDRLVPQPRQPGPHDVEQPPGDAFSRTLARRPD